MSPVKKKQKFRLAFPGRSPRSEFSAYFSQFVDSSNQMYLTHITDGYSLRDMIASRQIEPAPCKHFGNALIYTFLGRPAYRKHNDNLVHDYAHLFPVCFVIDPVAISAVTHVYPFDSGAFINNVFDNIIDDYVVIQDFSLNPTERSALVFLSKVFGNCENYYTNTSSTSYNPDDTQIEQKIYVGIARSNGRANISDDRCSAIEIATTGRIRIDKSGIAGIIMPHVFAKNPDYGLFIQNLGINVDHYHWSPRTRPIEHVGQIRDFVADLNRRRGWLP